MPRECPRNTFEYIVRAYDNLYSIARRFNVPIQQILRVNPSLNYYSRLRIGQTICIPRRGPRVPPCRPRNRYTVQVGDTLSRIASAFNVTVDELRRANPGLQQSDLSAGVIICIPSPRPGPHPGPGPGPSPCPHASVAYVINPGDTLRDIAYRYATTVQEILRLNPYLDPNRLVIGQRICIPGMGTFEQEQEE